VNERPFWFKRKRYGWGWSPGSPEGWVATAVFAVVTIVGSGPLKWDWPWTVVATIAFLGLVIAKGEPQ
jgi:hypothetical protein